MPADNLPPIEPYEFVRDIERVLTLLQPTHVYLTPTAPESEAENAWPLERTMLVWKDAARAWHFKMQLLGEQHQGVFDIAIEDDERVVDCLNALDINSNASEEISNKLGSVLLARIVRPCLLLSNAQQKAIIAPLDLSAAWPLDSDEPVDVKIQTCLALLRGEQCDGFSIYLTLETINQLAGGRIAEFCATNPNVTSGDVLRFIQLLLQASIKHIGHDEPVVLPAPPEGSDTRYIDVPREVEPDNTPLPEWLRQMLIGTRQGFMPVRPDMQTEIANVEAALTALEASVPNLSAEDSASVTQSWAELRTAMTDWSNSTQDMNHLLTFRRATDAVLREDHIQRLYTRRNYPRLGMFSDYVASPETQELQQLRLSFRALRDFSKSRIKTSKIMKEWRELLLSMLGLSLIAVLLCVGDLGVMALLAFPALALLVTSFVYGVILGAFLIDIFITACKFEFSSDLWNAAIEIDREFVIEDFPRALGAALVISAGYGLIAGELSAATGMLAVAGITFASSFLFMIAISIATVSAVVAIIVGYIGISYTAGVISEYIEDSNQSSHEEMLEDEVYAPEETGLAPP
ncbi:MAG: hypothetical protein P1U36_03270 [Legionellaceae bacterium]|nr:hypothetical protein [Legionellaceae bacterium]